MGLIIIHRHKRLSGHTAGTVQRADGVILGRAQEASRDAAGTYDGRGRARERRTFWTATIAGCDRAPSLGTRHPTRASAVRAIRAFHAEHPLYFAWGDPTRARWIAAFKSQHPEVCALPARKAAA